MFILFYIPSLLWLVLSILTFLGVYLDYSSWGINMIVGGFFSYLSFFFYKRTKVNQAILLEVKEGEIRKAFVFYELVFFLMNLALLTILTTGAFSRIFNEGLPLFG